MSVAENKSARKEVKVAVYSSRLKEYLDKYQRVVVVGADHVGSNQLQRIRQGLRGSAEILMGKNTLMRRAIRQYAESNHAIEPLLGVVKNNVGFVFTNCHVADIQEKISRYRVGAPAKAGAVAPIDVIVPKGPTGMEPTQTSFLHALNIGSKISKGQIEITSDVQVIKAGEKVGSSAATLLQRLNIKPFSYGLSLLCVFEQGYICEPDVATLTDSDILSKMRNGLNNVASLSLLASLPTLASLPHAFRAAYANVLSVAVETGFSIPEADNIRAYLANRPSQAIGDVCCGCYWDREDVTPVSDSDDDSLCYTSIFDFDG